MADDKFPRNSEANLRVTLVITSLAQSLQLKHLAWCPFDQDLDLTDHQPCVGSIRRRLPHAFGLFAVEEDVRLMCTTNMSLALFQQHLKERLGLEKDTMCETRGNDIFVAHEQLVKLRLALPNNLSLVLTNRHPHNNTGLEDEERHEESFKQFLDDPTEARQLFNLYVSTYLQLREWAYRVRIMSEECRLLSEKFLTRLHAEEFFRQIEFTSPPSKTLAYDILKSASFSTLTHVQHVDPRWSRNSAGHAPMIPIQHELAIARAIERTDESTTDLIAWTVDALESFISSYPIFVKIDVTCWDVRSQGKAAQHMFIKRVRQLVAQVQVYHDTRSQSRSKLVIWPEFSTPKTPLDCLSFLLGLNCHSRHDVESSAPAIEAACHNVLYQDDALERGVTILHSVMDRITLRNQIGSETDTIARNLPVIYSLHLDYIPLSDPDRGVDESYKEMALTSNPSEQNKFRTSHEVLNRLQWDTRHASKMYEVGYEDRFETDLLWKPLDEWTKDKQAEDFVPMHRIHQFREASTLTIVWDRDNRIDRT